MGNNNSGRRFVPPDLDPSDFSQIEPLYATLLARRLDSAEDLEQWLEQVSELTAVVNEYGTRREIDYSRHTDAPELEKAYLHYLENIAPKIKPYFFRLQRQYLDCGHANALADPKFGLLERDWKADVELYRDENVPLETELGRLNKSYDKLCGAMLVNFQGQQYTLQQLARLLEEPNRSTRDLVWQTMETRRAEDRDAIDDIFDKMLELRQTIANNAGLDDYRQFIWRKLQRFDYEPEDCHRFADTIEETCMPMVKQLNEQRRMELQLDRLRPWDLAVDPKNQPPLRPFDADNVAELVSGCQEIFRRLSPELAQEFSRLQMGRNLDLESRKGKRPGGYQASLAESKQPFIFMNAAGLHRDVETLLHEGGHAFHYLWSCHEPVLFLQHAPMEFCEVASMAMELMADQHLDVFYSPPGAARGARLHLEGVIRLLPWIATIDQFQHWLYSHPGHSRTQRTEAWRQIRTRFADDAVDWSNLDAFHDGMWQRQLHLFHVPFYYIEYGIAQLGALQLWMRCRQNMGEALADYRTALGLGGTRMLPDLFEAAGIRFDFSSQTLRPLIDEVHAEFSRLADEPDVQNSPTR